MHNRIIESIRQLADQAIALQNKDRMDAALREISALCGMTTGLKEPRAGEVGAAPSPMFGFGIGAAMKQRYDAENAELDAASAANLTLAERVAAQVPGSVLVSYGEAKSYDSEAEMIADIQGASSPVFPLPNQVVLDGSASSSPFGTSLEVAPAGYDYGAGIGATMQPAAERESAEQRAQLDAAQPGDTVQITGVSDGAGNEKVLSVKVTPPAAKSAKKGGAK